MATEREIEDYVQAHIGEFVHPDARCVARQLTLPSGRRIDLLAAHREEGAYVITVLELKARRACWADVVQLMDYMDELSLGAWANTPIRGLLLAPEVPNQMYCACWRIPTVHAHPIQVTPRIAPIDRPSRHWWANDFVVRIADPETRAILDRAIDAIDPPRDPRGLITLAQADHAR